MKIRIVSEGTGMDTRVYAGDELLQNVTRVEILPIIPGAQPVKARITFLDVELDIEAEVEEEDE